MDYSKLRAAAMRDGDDEEAVTVDTRALIDKVLARYSGEWTTLRELIQNAADAQATTVYVKWETLPSVHVPLPNTADHSDLLKHTLANHTLRRLVVQNNGQPFTKTDWGRLKRIAEGNPDETKIGAFGVGFYSVFADCEEPFVSSGSEAMAFYWKGNSLFTKKSTLPADQSSLLTAFVLDYRNQTTPMPNLLSVSQFLATSLTFVALEKIEFWIDDFLVLSLHKKTSPTLNLDLPRDLEAKTKDGFMKVVGVGRTSTQIDAVFMNAVGWKPQAAAVARAPESYGAPEAPSLKSFFARLTEKAASVSQKYVPQSEESIAQATLAEDPPPKTTRIAILTSSYDEGRASESSVSADAAIHKATDVFASVMPNKKPGGRIFIGFPTMQTTGAGMHISAPSVIPTVEREAIDLNARWVRTWNMELLRAAGIIARLAFAHEMEELDRSLRRHVGDSKKIPLEAISKFVPEALHLYKTFSFKDSTPNSSVGQLIEESFWICFKRATIEIFSTKGVLQSSQVRIVSEDLQEFVESIPVIPAEIREVPFIKKLIDFGLISGAGVADVKRELEAKALNKNQAITFIKWLGNKTLSGELDPGSRSALMDVAVASLSDDGENGEIVALGGIKHYLNKGTIPAHMPVPPSTVPILLSVGCSHSELDALGWEPLELVPWLRFVIETGSSRSQEECVTSSPKFAVSVLLVMSKNWDNMSSLARAAATTLLQATPMVPTRQGLRKPQEAFFPTVKLFDDLPIIQGCEKIKEKFLSAVGVRKTVDLETIFARLLNSSGEGGQKWSHMELIKYLASVQNDIPSGDLKKLRETKFCPAETGPKGMESTKASQQLYRVIELPEGRFLSVMGLRTFPAVPELVEMMTSSDESLRLSAMTYFIANHHSNRYAAFSLTDTEKAILPLQKGSKLVKPSACFTNEAASVLGFDILRRDLHDHANCGAKSEPTKIEVAQMVCNEPARLLGVLETPEKYLDLLKSLAEAHQMLRREKDLWRGLKTLPCLLAYKEIAAPSKNGAADLDDEQAPIKQYQLVSAQQIVVLDDIISYRLFKQHLICAPEEDILEKFYLQLGAIKLSILRKHVIERSKLFLYEYANYRKDAIKHDAKWLEKHLSVDMVQSLELRRSLQGHRQVHTEKRSAAASHASGSWTLYVADNSHPDMYQVGQALCQMLIDIPNQQAYLFFEPFLTLDLYGLRARGYNVDRILRAKAAEARIAEEARQRALEEERKMIQEREKAVTKVKEQATYCDKRPSQNIIFAAEAANGMKVYVSKDMEGHTADFLSANLGAINAFATLLVEIGGIYSLAPQVLHIFYAEDGQTIAFNTSGSLFCNLRYFLQLHHNNGARLQGAEKIEAATWWWITLAHELAHNIVGTHGQDHSYYT
ncbi:Sacsin [Escovopsis weberi]|uniref:Sacsin n=1 Tax=Escovopsis weberi TaxID=150374 RepID=A0A0N0RTH1_ESCWE|nr:Sacsin [Escovopsis weberi]